MRNSSKFWIRNPFDSDVSLLNRLSTKKTSKIVSIIAFLVSIQVFAADYTISSVDEFNDLNLSAGDTVTWLNGTYSSDERIHFSGIGTANNPILLKAETPGGVIFDNGLQMDISGEYLIVDGFYWNGGYGSSNFIQFRNGTTYAQHSTIQNCAINGLQVHPDDIESGTSVKHRWIVLYGNYNNVVNCTFMNKSNAGALILVELEYNAEVDRCTEVGHTIANNYFFNYEKIDTSLTNAGDSETIRVGTSEFQNVDCGTTVSNNYFVSADGENEIISNKSDNNIYINNTFRRSRGSLVLRHGSGATVQGNYFLGENVDGTGGIRIVDSDHLITNNYIQDCITVESQAKWNNGIIFMGGGDNSVDNCNSTSVSNGYQESEDLIVSNNTIINTNAPLYYNVDKGSNNVTGTVVNNLIYFENGSPNVTDVISGDESDAYASIGTTLSYSGNVYDGTALGENVTGFTSSNLTLTSNGEIFEVSGASGVGATIAADPITASDVGATIGACFLDSDGGVLNSCDDTNPPSNTLTVSSLNDFTAASESQTVTITSNVDWAISDNRSWISLSTTSGSNNGTTIVSVTTNSSTTERTGTLTITGGSLTRTLTITQAGDIGDIAVEDISLTPSSITLSIGESQQLSSDISPSNATNQEVSYTSTNTAIATVNSNGIVTGVGVGNAEITAITDDGEFTDSSSITVLASSTDINLALNKTITATGTPDGANIPSNVVDGSTDTRWSSLGFPKSFVIDLGAEYNIDKTEVVCFQDRAYQYTVESATTANGTYTEIVDRSSNTTSGTESNPITDNFSSIQARYVRVTVSGASGYSGSWVSLLEFRVFGNEVSTPNPNCTAGNNLSLDGTISNYTDQQTGNPASNIVDDNTTNRWSAQGFPQNTVIDLGDIYTVSEINLHPFNDRAYQFLVEGSSSSASSGFSTLTDATNNTTGGSVINRTFSSQAVRYVKLTITGASGYSGSWSSIREFEIICSGDQLKLNNDISLEIISIYPNPFTTNLTVQLLSEDTEITKAQIIDLYGREVTTRLKSGSSNTINLSPNLPQGVYFLRLLNANNKVIKTEKVISNPR